jgi:hypothetical protein
MPDFKSLIASAVPPALVQATSIVGNIGKRQIVQADRRYVLKPHVGDRTAANEAIVSTIGHAIGAPIADWSLVEWNGAAFGSALIATRRRRSYCEENSRRLAMLRLLGYLTAWGDQQYVFDLSGHVVGIDFGHYLGGPNWGRRIFSRRDVSEPRPVESLSPMAIANAVAAPHASWGLATADRVAAAEFIWERHCELIGPQLDCKSQPS